LFYYFHFHYSFVYFAESVPVVELSTEEESEDDEEDGCVDCLKNKEDDFVSPVDSCLYCLNISSSVEEDVI